MIVVLTVLFPEMNASFSERFKHRAFRPNTNAALSLAVDNGLDISLNREIRNYVTQQENLVAKADRDGWTSRPEIPTNDELAIEEAELLPNKIAKPYKSKEKYLRTHYDLLREDSLGCLRDAVQDFAKDPSANDTNKYSIYDQVHIVGFTFARRGLAARIKFTTNRAGKHINWGNSKRLVSGSMVALLPAKAKSFNKDDMIVAIIAARPLAGVMCEPPEVDIYFGRTEDIQIDPQKEWLMIEAKSGYFEAYRHTLKALQKLSQESCVPNFISLCFY
jgi:helicase required for RNAi-mediated heterochromatin assembly 1